MNLNQISNSSIISDSFQDTSYDSPINKKINISRLKVCNNMFKITNTNGFKFDLKETKNRIDFDFKYYSRSGVELETVPDVYFLSFDIF